MTVEAAREFEMGLPRFQMALRARRNRFLDFRRMADVAAQARDAPVFPSGRSYVFHRGGMTLHAFFFFIMNWCFGRRSG